MKLDLGGTMCYESKDAVIIADDGETAGDEVTPLVVGDYNRMPFVSDIFDEAEGTCYLEEGHDFKELARILKPGAKAIVTTCLTFDEANKGLLWLLQRWILHIRQRAKEAGFRVLMDNYVIDADHMVAAPVFRFIKSYKIGNIGLPKDALELHYDEEFIRALKAMEQGEYTMNRKQEKIIEEMRMIVFPGDYGLGSEPESIPDDNKKAWERLGELLDELEAQLAKR